MSEIKYTPASTGTTINPTDNYIPVRQDSTSFIDSNLVFDSANLYTQNSISANTFGFYIELDSFDFTLGDWQGINNATVLEIKDSESFIKTFWNKVELGLNLDMGTQKFWFGDYAKVYNGNRLIVDDSNDNITLDTNNGTFVFNGNLLNFNGALTSGSSGGSSGQHLQVTINGTAYVIALLNP